MPSPLPDDAASVEFDHVAFAYPTAEQVSLASLESVAVLDKRATAQVLDDVNFIVRPGQMVALVGHSGAGKTTITHLVSRLYDVTGGAVRVGTADRVDDVRDVTLPSLEDVESAVNSRPGNAFEAVPPRSLLPRKSVMPESSVFVRLRWVSLAMLALSVKFTVIVNKSPTRAAR